jgi:hypothetical protein
MIRPLDHMYEWRLLRALLRADTPLSGLEMRRREPIRGTKDGTFLDDLVRLGLIEAVGEPEADKPASAWSKPVPVQFRTRYRLTDLGRHAAEYGEYEWDFDAARRAREGGAK